MTGCFDLVAFFQHPTSRINKCLACLAFENFIPGKALFLIINEKRCVHFAVNYDKQLLQNRWNLRYLGN
jgi:hypothetical protein